MLTSPRRQSGPWRSRWPQGILLLTTCVLALSGCSGSDSSAKKALPGIKEFGLTDKEFAEHVEQTQQLIAECMTDAGFEYIPVDVKTVEAGQARVRTEPGYTRRTYKEKWGLAVTTRFDNPVRDAGLGPNLEIYNNLPASEQDAYFQTLFGDDWNADFVFALDEEDFSSTGGCTRKGVAAVFTDEQLKGSYVNPKDVLVDEDPRIINARKQWSQCMHDAGYEYEEDQDEIIEEYGERLADLLDGDDPSALTGQRAAALKDLQQDEIAVALSDMDCQVKHTDEITRQVEFEIFGRRVSG